MSRFRDLTGLRYERLTVMGRDDNVGRFTSWRCKCDCGNEARHVLSHNLIDKHTKSCGCLHDELVAQRNRRPITYYIDGNTAICTTYSGIQFFVDAEDIGKIFEIGWFVDRSGYVKGAVPGEERTMPLHRYILGYRGRTYQIDHKDRNKLNNRKENLRICTAKENSRNSTEKSNNTSGFSGVSYYKPSNKWRARIMVDGKEITLGYYNDYAGAVRARWEGEYKYFGEFAPHTEQDVINAIREHERRTE